MKRKNIVFLKVLPILLLILTTWINTAKAQGVDAVFFLDNSSSIDDTEWIAMSNSTKALIDKVLECNPNNRIAVTHFAGIYTTPNPITDARIFIENNFTDDSNLAKSFVRRGGLATQGATHYATLGNNTWLPENTALLQNSLGSSAASSQIVSTQKKLSLDPNNKLVIFIFTDGTAGGNGLTSALLGFSNYNTMKSSLGATFVVIHAPTGVSTSFDTAARAAAAAIASVGGDYNGTVQANAGDPQGSGVKPRKAVMSDTFDISSINIETLAGNICKSCAPVVAISAITPPTQNVCLNGVAQPLVSTATGTGTLTYQWYSNTTNSTTGGTLISGATSATYNPPTSAAGTRYYYVVVSDSYCEGKATSAIVSVTVSNIAAGPVPSFNNTSAYSNTSSFYQIPCGSTSANLSSLAVSNPQVGTVITWHSSPVATSANIITPANALPGTNKYYAAFYNSTGNCYSPTKMVTVVAPICAVNDDYTSTPIIAGVGGTLPSIFGNDTYNGTVISTMPANSVDFFYEMWTTANATVDGNGNLVIPATTPPGTYTYYYKICDKDSDVATETNCTIAEVKFKVEAVFGCDNKVYLSQNNILYTINTSSNPFTYPTVGSAAVNHNAMGLNPVDGKIYAMQVLTSNVLLQINTDGSSTSLGAVTNLPVATYNAGEIDNAGNYYVKSNAGNNQLYKINLTTKTATLITLSTSVNVSDLSFSIATGLLYGVNSANGQLTTIDPSTGAVTGVGITPGSLQFGAMYTSSTGEVFGVNNAGGFYQFNLTTGARVKISDAPASTSNDGAHCVTMPITFSADLQVTKSDNTTTYIPGAATVYTITVRNNGPFGVLNASISDPVPAGIPAANVSYTAVASTGSTTNVSGTQTGAINDLVGIPMGGTVIYTVTVNVPMSFTGNLVNTVTVTPPTNISDSNMANNTATDTDTHGSCFKPGITTGTALDTKHGISALNRAGSDAAGNWPMVRKGAWTALEAKTKGFVVNRLTTAEIASIPTSNLIEGMMVYNKDLNCLQVNTTGTATGWSCLSTPTCPSN
ncbi:hypothetical protein OF897_15720 [Chryseobacterium formosus]|uniref:VWFA domain-containing protein n=1 Tax=Chryseobacterium formosus TaxID=1537363 RepID=A0ABT3XUQ2_9FLAO|nr:hypothetical protein [Chryseobacterium formosus]MCX8525367.1 hypothetical protein [Chryseobacterium formosus]